jgi:hypothetical protein
MMRIFVNAKVVEVDAGSDVRGSLRVYDAALADRVAAGTAYVTDARGIELAPDAPLAEGSILRVVVSARRGAEASDADP